VGARSINYTSGTQDGETRYLYLQVNPVVWFAALTGALLSAAFTAHSVLVAPDRDRDGRFLMMTFLVLYIGYMLAISRIDRVLYLYHYFLPLVFSFFLLGLAIKRVRRLGRYRLGDVRKVAGPFVLAALIIIGFRFYYPLTYYQPLSDDALRARALFPL
jgi:dolichyl-phosphate-mannose--protein O-mannosyl transferase